MKAWNVPEVAELNINETANGILDVNFEGPHDIIFGDKRKPENPNPSTPDDHS